MGFGFLRGNPLGENVLAGISAAIAAIPEEPPILLAVILGLGAYRLLRRGVLVRRLSAEETLGAVDLIITDKTGTLTANRLAVREVLTPDGPVADPRRAATAVIGLRSARRRTRGTSMAVRDPGHSRRPCSQRRDPRPRARPDQAELRSAEGPSDGRPWSTTWSRRDGADEGPGDRGAGGDPRSAA